MSDNEGLSLMDDREEEPRRAAADAEGGVSGAGEAVRC